MKVFLVGSGGREHALGWSFTQAEHQVVSAPGNPGLADLGDCLPVSTSDVEGLVRAARECGADLMVVGPEAPLAEGIVDLAQQAGLVAFGPTAAGARIEASKAFAKSVMKRGGVPTARYELARDLESGLKAVRSFGGKCVVKADGLAAGKGVVVAYDLPDAEAVVRECFNGDFGVAGSVVVVEELLEGPELSLLVVCDGKRTLPLPPAQDHKRLGDGDTGANTGGMGAFSPVPSVTDRLVDDVMASIVEPTMWSLAKEGITYRGVLYVGLMLTAEGPKVLEFNCRFGDPETQAVIPRLDVDLAEVLHEAARGDLSVEKVAAPQGAAVNVVAAAEGYPGQTRTGDAITGLEAAGEVEGALVFQAGTELVNDELVTAGGRVLSVTGTGPTLEAARDVAYQAISKISWPGIHYRTDVAAT